MTKPTEHFRKTFSIHPAASDTDRESIFHIRYQVYCQEFEYEKLPEHMGEREMDEYDAQSSHCLLEHKASNRPIGCARLVLVDPQHLERPLPFWKYCPQAIDTSKFNPAVFKPGQLAEFSRIAIIEEFRRREKIASRSSKPSVSHNRRYSDFPVIPVCLFLASLSMLLNSEAEYGVAMMEPKLVRLLRKYGILFESIGNAVEYHGLRAPYIIHRDNVLKHFTQGVDDLFFEIHSGLQARD